MAQVRSLRESRGDVTEAGPSIAVQMIGLNGVPSAGDEFAVCASEQEVRPSIFILPIIATLSLLRIRRAWWIPLHIRTDMCNCCEGWS